MKPAILPFLCAVALASTVAHADEPPRRGVVMLSPELGYVGRERPDGLGVTSGFGLVASGRYAITVAPCGSIGLGGIVRAIGFGDPRQRSFGLGLAPLGWVQCGYQWRNGFGLIARASAGYGYHWMPLGTAIGPIRFHVAGAVLDGTIEAIWGRARFGASLSCVRVNSIVFTGCGWFGGISAGGTF